VFVRIRAHGECRGGNADRGDEAGKDHGAGLGARTP
jgi:hypothetical protein